MILIIIPVLLFLFDFPFLLVFSLIYCKYTVLCDQSSDTSTRVQRRTWSGEGNLSLVRHYLL